jgi:hypothetical protein
MKLFRFFQISILFFGILITSCREKDEEFFNTAETAGQLETFEMPDKYGEYYSVTIQRIGNRVIYNKKVIAKTANSLDHITVFSSIPGQNKYTTSISFHPGKRYWFVPIKSGLPIVELKPNQSGNELNFRASGDIKCWCEEIITGEHCDGPVPGGCEVDFEPDAPAGCISDPCCGDCDMSVCIDTHPVTGTEGGGTIIEADSIIFGQNGSNFIYEGVVVVYGGHVKIRLEQIDTTLVVERISLEDTVPYANRTIVLADIKLNINNELPTAIGGYWFIPFDLNTNVWAISGNIECSSDSPPCSGECSAQSNQEGCLECECSETGDCDATASNGSVKGGLIVKAQNIDVTDY